MATPRSVTVKVRALSGPSVQDTVNTGNPETSRLVCDASVPPMSRVKLEEWLASDIRVLMTGAAGSGNARLLPWPPWSRGAADGYASSHRLEFGPMTFEFVYFGNRVTRERRRHVAIGSPARAFVDHQALSQRRAITNRNCTVYGAHSVGRVIRGVTG